MTAAAAPTLAVWKFASCDGCQLSLLSAEDELLSIAGAIRIASFPEATRAQIDGPYDVSLVEGSITTPHDAERILEVRAASRMVITIGACATAGGIQALRNVADVAAYQTMVYPHPEYLDTLASSTAIAQHIPVDYELQGCPVETRELVEVISALLAGRRPAIEGHPVCVDCKLRGLPCVLVTDGQPCLGPVTHTGCGARCPAVGRACYGCFGPAETPNTASLADWLGARHDRDAGELARRFRTFNADAAAFRREARRQEQKEPT